MCPETSTGTVLCDQEFRELRHAVNDCWFCLMECRPQRTAHLNDFYRELDAYLQELGYERGLEDERLALAAWRTSVHHRKRPEHRSKDSSRVKLSPEEWRTVAEAIIVRGGRGRSSWPLRDDEAVAKRFGRAAAAKLLPIIRELEGDFYSTDASHKAANLVEMGDIASQQFRAKYPDAPEDAVRGFEWCYTFDNK